MPPSDWFEDPERPFAHLEATICPGYSIRLPEVIDAARLLGWRRDGQLQSYAGNRLLPPCAADAVDILDSQTKLVEQEDIRRRNAEIRAKNRSDNS